MPEAPQNLLNLTTRGPVLVVTVAATNLTAVEATDQFDRQIAQILQSRAEKRWVIDFQSVTFMVTPAVSALIGAAKHLKRAGGELVITGLNRNIRQIFTLMRLDAVIPIAASVDAAARALAAAQ